MSWFRFVGGAHHLSKHFSVQKVQRNSRGSLSASRIPGKIELSGPRSLTRCRLQFLEPFEHAELRTQCCQGGDAWNSGALQKPPVYGSEGWEFESSRARHFFNELI